MNNLLCLVAYNIVQPVWVHNEQAVAASQDCQQTKDQLRQIRCLEKFANRNLSQANTTSLAEGEGECLNPWLDHGEEDGDDGQDHPGSQEGWLGL